MTQNGKKQTEGEITIKESSSKLDISESTVKKYLRDFDLEIIKDPSNKAAVSQDTFQILSEIVKLRANGLSIQEIKELKTQKPSKHILDEVEETEQTKTIEITENESSENISVQESVPNVPATLDEAPIDEKLAISPGTEDLQREDLQREEDQGERRQRRGFNYRYIERQISNDSKKVSAFRNRLRNPNLPIQEKLFFEEALDRRILFLNGWKHLLRWVSKQ